MNRQGKGRVFSKILQSAFPVYVLFSKRHTSKKSTAVTIKRYMRLVGCFIVLWFGDLNTVPTGFFLFTKKVTIRCWIIRKESRYQFSAYIRVESRYMNIFLFLFILFILLIF